MIESESYWDKEKKQPRSHRKIIGKIDPVTGEMVPTDRHQKRVSGTSEAKAPNPAGETDDHSQAMAARIQELEQENARLRKEKEAILEGMERLAAKYRG